MSRIGLPTRTRMPSRRGVVLTYRRGTRARPSHSLPVEAPSSGAAAPANGAPRRLCMREAGDRAPPALRRWRPRLAGSQPRRDRFNHTERVAGRRPTRSRRRGLSNPTAPMNGLTDRKRSKRCAPARVRVCANGPSGCANPHSGESRSAALAPRVAALHFASSPHPPDAPRPSMPHPRPP